MIEPSLSVDPYISHQNTDAYPSLLKEKVIGVQRAKQAGTCPEGMGAN